MADAAKSDKEHRDFYIAMIVGGLGLILILLWLFTPSAVAADTGGTSLDNPLLSTMPPGASDYNYNIPGYNPGTPIVVAQPTIPNDASGCGCGGNGYAACGPVTGNNPVNVAQFSTLINGGA